MGVTSLVMIVCFGAVTPVQSKSIAPTIPNWGPTTPALQGQNPLVFEQFDPKLGQLQSVNLDVTFTVTALASMTFTTPATITLRNSSAQDASKGPQITLNGPNSNLLTENAPVFTFVKTYGGTNEPLPRSFSFSDTLTRSRALVITDPGQLQLFTGTGTVGLPAFASAGTFFSTSSGNGSGSILTRVGVVTTLSYSYVIPEPASLALLVIGMVVLFWWRRTL